MRIGIRIADRIEGEMGIRGIQNKRPGEKGIRRKRNQEKRDQEKRGQEKKGSEIRKDHRRITEEEDEGEASKQTRENEK